MHLAWERASSDAEAWRMHYNLPPNDSRYLDLEEDEMQLDLLVIKYHRFQQWQALHKDDDDAERRTLDPKSHEARQARGEALRDAMVARQKIATKPKPVARLTMSGRVVGGKK